MDYKTFWRETYTHYCNLTVALAVIPTIGNKKTVLHKTERF